MLISSTGDFDDILRAHCDHSRHIFVPAPWRTGGDLNPALMMKWLDDVQRHRQTRIGNGLSKLIIVPADTAEALFRNSPPASIRTWPMKRQRRNPKAKMPLVTVTKSVSRRQSVTAERQKIVASTHEETQQRQQHEPAGSLRH